VDPTGHYLETAWDIISFTTGVISFVGNVKEGNWGDAALDLVGVVGDGCAIALPFIPGGCGTAIKAVRYTKAGCEFVGGIAGTYSGIKNVCEGVNEKDNGKVILGTFQTVSGIAQAKNATNTIKSVKSADINQSTSAKSAPVGLSKKALKHPLNRHDPNRVAEQISRMSPNKANEYIGTRSFFNKSWSEKKITKALNKGYQKAIKEGITDGKYVFKYMGEKITICIDNGIFKTGYGNHYYSAEELLNLLR
jgi:hypothetical protein